MMNCNLRGLTFFEVIVVMAILAIVSAFVVPGFIGWRSDMKLRSAANNLKGDLEMAKARAIRENNYVVIRFEKSGYVVFIDNGAGAEGIPANWTRDGEELLLRDRQMPSGVKIDLADTTFGEYRTRFTSRGHTTNGHTAVLNQDGERIRAILFSLGKITLERQ
jgi:prepilin-type N-terminal cleavage/methylation domain-containing protein